MPTNRLTRRPLHLEGLELRDNPSRGLPLGVTLPTFTFVSGSVYADANGNGVRDAGENGVNGVTVYADWNDNGQRDAGEPSAVTQSSLTLRSENGVTTARNNPGSYFFNAGGRGAPASAPVRVELPAGAAQTTAVPAFAKGGANTFHVGLAGVTGQPSTPAEVPGGGGITFSTGSSSGSVTATAGPTGSSVSASIFSSGSGSVTVSATASYSNGVGFTSVYVG